MPFVTKVLTSDNKIWNQPQVLLDIAFAMSQNLDLEIDLLNEGPDFLSLDLDAYIQSQSQRYRYDLNRLTIRTANMAETYATGNVKKAFPVHLMINTLDYNRSIEKSHDLKHFGLFIGRLNPPRLYFSYYLSSHHSDKIIHSNQFNSFNDFYCANIGLEELYVRYGIKNLDEIAKYLISCPINGQNKEYGKNPDYNHAQHLLLQDRELFTKKYNDFFLEVVCETYFTGNTFFPTEKTWRPILLKTPFIIQGPKGYLKNLKEMGFKTFSHWWDEGYDEDDPGTSWIEISKVVDQLAVKSQQELSKMLVDMKDVLEHNHSRFIELCTNQNIKKILKNKQ